MSNLLLKLFIRDYKNTTSPIVREKYGILSGIVGIVLNIFLFALKLALGLFINSVSVTADAFNNLADSASSILTLFGFKLSNKPADREHPFGHGRAEDIVSLVIAVSILLLGYEFMRASVGNILSPPEIYFNDIVIGLLILSILVKVWMFLFNRRLSKDINSSSLFAIAIDSKNDVFITSVTVASILFTVAFGVIIDGFVGVFVAFMLLRSGYHLAKDNLSAILGKPIDKATADKIKDIILSHDGVIGVHDLIVHSYGSGRKLATIHGEVSLDTPFTLSHKLGETAEKAVLEQLDINIIIRLDPVDINDDSLIRLKNQVIRFLAKTHPETNAHDFRMLDVDSCKKGSNFIFELEIPYEYNENEQSQLLEAIKAVVREMDEGYQCVVNLEYGYVEK